MQLRQQNLEITSEKITGTLYWYFDENAPATTLIQFDFIGRKAKEEELLPGTIISEHTEPILLKGRLTRKNEKISDDFDYSIPIKLILSEKSDGRVTINYIHPNNNIAFFSTDVCSENENILQRMLDLFVSEVLFKLYHIYSVEPFNIGLQKDMPIHGPFFAIKNNFDFS